MAAYSSGIVLKKVVPVPFNIIRNESNNKSYVLHITNYQPLSLSLRLPIPWMVAMAVGKNIVVDADGMFCSVVMLFAMLMAIICIIAICKWQMTKILGFSMFVGYFCYLAVALSMGLDKIPCAFDK